MRFRMISLLAATLMIFACNVEKAPVEKPTVNLNSSDEQKFSYMLGTQFGNQFAAIGRQFRTAMDPEFFIQGIRDSRTMKSDSSFRLPLSEDTLRAVGLRFQKKAEMIRTDSLHVDSAVKPLVPRIDALTSVTPGASDDQKFAYMLGVQFGAQFSMLGDQFKTVLDDGVFILGFADSQRKLVDSTFQMPLPADTLHSVSARYQARAQALREEARKQYQEQEVALKKEVAPLRGDTLPDGMPKKMNFSVKVSGITVETSDLQAYARQPLLIFYFSATCGHCRHAEPEVQKIVNDFRMSGLSSIAIASGGNDKRTIRGFMDDLKMENMTILFDDSREFGELYSDGYVPKVYVVHPDGSYTLYKNFIKETDQVRKEITAMLKK